MKVEILDATYELKENYREGFDKEEVIKRATDYFTGYDYIFGDWAYGKLRLKGFYDSSNKKAKELNDIRNLKKYITNNCAYGCKYFLLGKIKNK